MEINSLLKTQIVLVAKHQIEWQKIVKKAIAKYGVTDKAAAEIRKNLKSFAEQMTEDGLKLGMKWLG